MYYQSTVPARTYQTSTVQFVNTESAECKFIQEKKDELLISLTKYFAKEMEKPELTSSLNSIKNDLVKNCPSYISRPGCC